MRACAYCDKKCRPTREHVIPRWYNDTPGDSETFSARAPHKHTNGDLIVKDVCRICNNGPLGKLDAYGRELYHAYFARPVYMGESVEIEFDGDRLIRWLLKLSFNSARAQNADTRVLSGFRKAMLGQAPITPQVRCWLQFISPTCISQNNIPTPASIQDLDRDDIVAPTWFRIAQLRLPIVPFTSLVQRQVMINSYSFTLLIAPIDMVLPDTGFTELVRTFETEMPGAVPILLGQQRICGKATGDHTVASISQLHIHYPGRYLSNPHPLVAETGLDNVGAVLLEVTKEMVQRQDLHSVVNALESMVVVREAATMYRQRVGLIVSGYDDDPRPLWQISETRHYLRRLFEECPYVMLLANPDSGFLRLLAACWVYEDGECDENTYKQKRSEFLNIAFNGLNVVAYRLFLSEEINYEVSKSAVKSLNLDAE